MMGLSLPIQLRLAVRRQRVEAGIGVSVLTAMSWLPQLVSAIQAKYLNVVVG